MGGLYFGAKQKGIDLGSILRPQPVPIPAPVDPDAPQPADPVPTAYTGDYQRLYTLSKQNIENFASRHNKIADAVDSGSIKNINEVVAALKTARDESKSSLTSYMNDFSSQKRDPNGVITDKAAISKMLRAVGDGMRAAK